MRELTYEDSQSKQNPMKEYMESLRNQDDIFSGDEYLLPSDLLKIYGKYEIACEEYHSARCSGLVCKEDLEDIGNELKTAYKEYRTAMKDAVSQYQSVTVNTTAESDIHKENDQEEERSYRFHR
ncbi:hypothetical protein [Bacteroides sp. 51]|uniref:hypothetical protein n=1 Tax=Bacteroides sp. 51 TaxID=2302938 RepID=UPI0013D5D9BA|nr:hypothetical protein [Bacteroides sp. 51]NDV84165.1 hypothetical protein [Bacteroides sp. 51]